MTSFKQEIKFGTLSEVWESLKSNKYSVHSTDSKGDTPLHHACTYGTLDMVQMLISEFGADISIRNSYNDTPLHVAAFNGKEDVVVALISKFNCDVKVKGQHDFGCGVGIKGNKGQSVLHNACAAGNLSLVRTLIRNYQADIKVQDDNRDTPLHVAAASGNETVAFALINEFHYNIQDSLFSRSLLHRACLGGNINLVRGLILDHQADVKAVSDDGNTPLNIAALNGMEKVALLLIKEFGSDVKVKGSFGRSVLHHACYGGNTSLVRTLIRDHNVDVMARDDSKATPLHIAAIRGNEEVVLTLINEFECKVKAKGERGSSVLHYACAGGNVSLVRTLINEHKADIKFPNADNNPPIHSAALNGKKKVVETLLKEFNCDFNVKGCFGRSLLHQACHAKSPDLVKFLLQEMNLSPNLLDNDGKTPLHYCSKLAAQECAKHLLAANASLDIKNKDGVSPLDMATDEIKSQFDNHLKDIEIEKYIEDIEATGGKNDRKLAHITFVGPPGSGKSSLMNRLLGRLNKKFSASTGESDSVIIVDFTNPSTFHSATLVENIWEETEYDTSLVRLMRNKSSILGQKNTLSSAHKGRSSPLEIMATSVSTSTASAKSSSFHLPSASKDIIRSVMKKYGYKEVTKYLGKVCSLYLRDIGRQMEFQETLPLLISGPSIIIIVFRADLDFESKFEVRYKSNSNEFHNCYITTKEALLQSLASVYAMDTSNEDIKSHQPLVFIVGTHIDKLGSEREAKICHLNQHLDFIIKNNGFEDFVHYADEHKCHVMFTIDNTSESNESFELIRSRINNLIINHSEFSIEYPISYLLFCLDLQNTKKSILTLEECHELAASHGIMEDQVPHLLRFLHLRVGLIRYYNVEGLRHLIIIEPQVLFDQTKELIAAAFSNSLLFPGQATRLKRKGILSAKAFANLENFSNKISAKDFFQLLVHHRIAAPFHVTEGKYFIPCVLNHATESVEESSETDIVPLCVKFECNHCPKGIYGALVTHLIQPGDHRDTKLMLKEDCIFKDQVSFVVQSLGVLSDKIVMKLCTSCLEIKFLPELSNNRDTPVKKVCDNIRQIVEESILNSLKDLHYTREKFGPIMCFKCEHCSELHPVIKGEKHQKISCERSRKTSRIPPSGRCWYNEDGDTGDDARSISATPSQASNEENSSSVTGGAALVRERLKHSLVLKELMPLAVEWHTIGILLGIDETELEKIKKNNFYQVNDCLKDMISAWLKMDDPEPTWERLKEALEVLKLKKAQYYIKSTCSTS